MRTLWAALSLSIVGCAGVSSPGVSPGGSRAAVTEWASSRGFVAETLPAGPFALFSLYRSEHRPGGDAGTLSLYIEGDGAPWPSPFQPPRDPTPLRSTPLTLAALDPSPAVAYLGRPCHYPETVGRGCDPRWWTSHRFAPEVVEAMDQAVDRLKAQAGASRVRLIGFSGGGVIAALLALRRDDLAGLVTIAAPLALADWTQAQGLTPLTDSLDPATQPDPAGRLRHAIHFAGADDEVVPPRLIAGFLSRHGGRLAVLPGIDHDCCWASEWPALLQPPPTPEGSP